MASIQLEGRPTLPLGCTAESIKTVAPAP